jgi:hypothetical protein
MIYPDDVRVSMNADLNLATNGAVPWLRGRVDLSHTILSRADDEGLSARDQLSLLLEKFALVPAGAPLPVDYELSLRTKEPIEISSEFGKIGADLDIHLSGNQLLPEVDGTIQIHRDSKLFWQTIASKNSKSSGQEEIESIEWQNDTPWSDRQLENQSGIKIGSRFDYWDVQQKLASLKESMQEAGYMLPVTDVQVTKSRKGIRLLIIVKIGEKGQTLST